MSLKPRARRLGIPFDGEPGVANAITDVAGVTVGHSTTIQNDINTGVTAILPCGNDCSLIGLADETTPASIASSWPPGSL